MADRAQCWNRRPAGNRRAVEGTETVVEPGPPLAGRYRLDGVLGTGGMAMVHQAWDERLDRAVAVKLYKPNADPVAHLRFAEEARTLANLSCPGLVTVYDVGNDGGQPFLVMQLIAGRDLRERLTDGPMSPADMRTLGWRLAETLAHVHDRGLSTATSSPPMCCWTASHGRTWRTSGSRGRSTRHG